MPGPHRAEPGSEISDEHVAELARLDLDYWWYAVRLAHVGPLLAGSAAPGTLDYLDFGCGEGKLTERIIADVGPRRALGIDGTEGALAVCRERGVNARRVDFREPFELPFPPNAITCLDVLEHLEDPVSALVHLARAAAPGATLIATVPAMPSLRSTWDDVSGHVRRYTRRELRNHLSAGGWTSLRLRYIFGYCVPPAWIQRRLLRRVQRFEFPVVSPATNRLMTLAGHFERRLGSPLPFGTSLLAVARRNAS